MATAAAPATSAFGVPPPATAATPRVPSVDAHRALVMFTMLFVNDVAGVHGIPAWMKHHHPEDSSGMTFVDLVFPAFLFLVGMSIPLALHGRLSRNVPPWRIVSHILTRGLSLLLIGVFMVNMESIGTKQMNWPRGLWQTLVFSAVILAFHSLPLRSRVARALSITTRILGFAALAYLATRFQDRHGDRMQPHWWGILGLIGFAYTICAFLYLPLRRHRTGLLIASLAILCLWVLGDKWDWLTWIPFWDYLGGTTIGSQPAITMAGVALATTFAGPTALPTTRDRLTFAIGLAIAATLGALLLHDAYGINKNNATPSWCLWSIAITTTLWIPFHAILDRNPNHPLAPHLGANVLMAYILADLIAYLLQLAHTAFYSHLGSTPTTGIPRSLTFAATLLLFCALLDRLRIRLKV
jgi:heparan-alpha-glucosaminide N-acetyltransferase